MSPNCKLLIIDDNENIITLLSSYFLTHEYSVITAKSGLEALKIIKDEQDTLDLIITDIVIPDISGVGLISIVKKQYPDLPVIAITGWGSHLETLAGEAFADLVLQKPLDLNDLKENVSRLIELKHLK